MGIDISINTDIDDKVFSADYIDPEDVYFHTHSLSHTFCNFISRRDVVDCEPELDQIGQLTSVDISLFYQMEAYGSVSDEELEFFFETAQSEEERKNILNQAQQNKDNPKGNITHILTTISTLIDKLSKIESLPLLLNDCGYDTLNSKEYFSDFSIDKGDGYIGNNLGQDLRNFKKFVEYAKDKGATIVYFNYG